jgi:voltage-gated potassium channel
MKAFAAVISAFLDNRSSRTNLKTLLRLLGVLACLILLYTILFHVLMIRAGETHSWLTGLYWTLTTMSTLGFGDITFEDDLGRLFSIIVLVSGVMFLLVILPFTFIEFFYAPWMKAQAAARTPRTLPPETKGHVIFTSYDPLMRALVPLLQRYGYPHFLLCSQVSEALEYYELGIPVALGDRDDPETYRNVRFSQAAMLVASCTDVLNTNITFTAREFAESVPIVATATTDASRDVLELAGADLVLRPELEMGWALARRVIGKHAATYTIGTISGLVISEANAAGTTLEGRTLAESNIRKLTGANVIGIWDHGRLKNVDSDTLIRRQTVLVLAGTPEQMEVFDTTFIQPDTSQSHVIIVGGGRVGRITSKSLGEAGFRHALIEKIPERVSKLPDAIIGDATDMTTLRAAHAREAAIIIITTHDDDVNISLTIFFRRLRENLQIISRCTNDRNVQTLHRAGADLVLSSASMGAHSIFNLIRGSDNLLLAQGVIIFPSPIPQSLAGRRLADCAIRSQTGCTVIAVEGDGTRVVNPDPKIVLPLTGSLLLTGTLDAEEKFLRHFKPDLASRILGKRW